MTSPSAMRHEDQQGGERGAEATRGDGRRDEECDCRDPGPASDEGEQPAQAEPAGAADTPPGQLVAGLGDRDDRAFARLPHQQLVGDLSGLHDALGQPGPGVDAAPLAPSSAGPRDHVGQAADHAGRGHDDADPEVEDGGHRRGQRSHEDQTTYWQPAAQLPVEDTVDVVDDRGQDVATTRTETPGRERHQRVVHLGAAASQHAQGRVVGEQPLGVPQHRTGQSERPDEHDRDQQGQHGRAARGLHDEPTRGRP